jgi:hypothetical protein
MSSRLSYFIYELGPGSNVVSSSKETDNYFWGCFRRAVIVKEPGESEDGPVDLIPENFAARTLAQEYGGGPLAIKDNTLIFSNYKDQRLYKQSIGGRVDKFFLVD